MGESGNHLTWRRSRRWQLLAGVLMATVGLTGLLRHAQATEGRWRAAEGPSGSVETEVAGAVEVRESAMVPTSIDHLVVVRVSVTRCGERAFGTGVLIDDNLLVTAAHVVGDAGLVRVDQGGVTVTGEVLGVLADGRDLALIEVDGPLDGPIASAAAPRTGSPVTVAGHPGGNAMTTVVGAKVELASSLTAIARGPAFGVSASTDLGMSGAPAIDEDGRLVGVVIGAETATGTAIVAAVEDVQELVEQVVVPGRCPMTA